MSWRCIVFCGSARTAGRASAPSIKTIEQAVRMSENTVYKYIRQLEELELATARQRTAAARISPL